MIYSCPTSIVSKGKIWNSNNLRLADWDGKGDTAGEEPSKIVRIIMELVETFCEDFFYLLADRCVTMREPLFRRTISVGIP